VSINEDRLIAKATSRRFLMVDRGVETIITVMTTFNGQGWKAFKGDRPLWQGRIFGTEQELLDKLEAVKHQIHSRVRVYGEKDAYKWRELEPNEVYTCNTMPFTGARGRTPLDAENPTEWVPSPSESTPPAPARPTGIWNRFKQILGSESEEPPPLAPIETPGDPCGGYMRGAGMARRSCGVNPTVDYSTGRTAGWNGGRRTTATGTSYIEPSMKAPQVQVDRRRHRKLDHKLPPVQENK